MKQFFILLVSSLVTGFAFSALAGPAVLIEENGSRVQTTQPLQIENERSGQQETRIQPLSQRSSLREKYVDQQFDSALDMRAKRRVGVGAMAEGNTGLLGALIELNFAPENSVITAFGGGPGFNSFNFQWKHVFGGESFSPYAGVGYARWYSASGNGNSLDKSTPALLSGKFLSENQKRSGHFAIDLLTPTLGIQYNQLFGDYVGTAVFAEITFLTSLSDLSPAPNGGIGALYYF